MRDLVRAEAQPAFPRCAVIGLLRPGNSIKGLTLGLLLRLALGLLEDFRDSPFVLFERDISSRQSIAVFNGKIGARGHERFHGRKMAIISGEMQRRIAVLAAGVEF